MVVFSNRRLGPSCELLVSDEVARSILRGTADAARPAAAARWEIELVRWLDGRAECGGAVLDVEDIAWTPERFEEQRRFVLRAIELAATVLASDHAPAFGHWRKMIEAHPAALVNVGRRWRWPNNLAPESCEESPMRDTAADVADGGERGSAAGYVGTADLPLGR